jgi:hypothetical protein
MFALTDGAFLGINIETMQQDIGLYLVLCNGILSDIYVTNMRGMGKWKGRTIWQIHEGG